MLRRLARPDSDEDRLLREAAGATAVRMAGASLAYALQVVLARALSESEYGLFGYVWIWLLILGHVAPAGFAESCIRFIPQLQAQGRHGHARGFLRTSAAIVAGGSLAFAAAGMFLLAVAGDLVSSAYLLPLLVMLASLPFFAFQDYLEGIARSFGWNMLALAPGYVLRPLLLILFFLGALAAGFEPTAATAMGSMLGALALLVLAQAAALFHRAGRLLGPARPVYQLRSWVTASLPLAFVFCVEQLNSYADMLVLGLYVPANELGLYFAASKTVALALLVRYGMAAVAGRAFSLESATGHKARLQALVSHATRWTLWPTAGAVAGLALGGAPLLAIFGPSFEAAYPALLLLAVGLLAPAAVGPVEDLLIVQGHQHLNLKITAATLLLNVALNFAFVPLWGIVGAALATGISLTVRAALFAAVTYRITGLRVASGWHPWPAEKGAA